MVQNSTLRRRIALTLALLVEPLGRKQLVNLTLQLRVASDVNPLALGTGPALGR